MFPPLMSEPTKLSGPDLMAGVAQADVPDGGMLLGHAGGEAVLLARHGEEIFAIGATCTHYSGPLAEGVLSGFEVRCPWHHACFDVRTGQPCSPPALNPVASYEVVRQGDRVRVAGKRASAPAQRHVPAPPASVVIIGSGAAGAACAEMLRREGYAGPVTMIGAEETVPVDRPNLSKDYLAGNAPEEWIPLRSEDFYREQRIELVRGVVVDSIDPTARTVALAGGKTLPWGALVLATGAEPIRLQIPGAERAHTLRTLADSRAIVAAAKQARRAVVIGASFIGLEVAASLRAREVETHVVAPETVPLERVLGPELGAFVRALHEEHGVRFHLGRKPAAIEAGAVTLDDGSRLEAELVVMGVGVRPRTELAQAAGLRVDRGIVVDEYLETSAPGIFAAGDAARHPGPDGLVRIEHWVVAERLGQYAARNVLGQKRPYRETPFFWSQHYDVPIAYVGHAESWDAIEVRGDIAKRDCVVLYRQGGRVRAVASIYRDRASLLAELALARGDAAALERI
jgi:NADPH-dependent 2,4-dienoyl-CoA reductase/sulfur reductase-like enzyme/nitrite reductase/ring-hydroxylating ferredoxin subunit